MAYETEFDPDTESASAAVIQAIAVAENKEPLELPSLFESIDPDALDTLFKQGTSEGKRTTFTHDGYLIEVSSEGRIRICDANEGQCSGPTEG